MGLPVSWQQRALALANAANNLIDLKNERLSAETQPPGRLPGDPSMTIGDPDGYRSYHAQWPFVVQVDKADELLWVA